MSQLIPFEFESKSVRVVIDSNGEPLFVAKDVLENLNYPVAGGVGKYIDHVPVEWKGGTRISTLGGDQEVVALTEQGLYFFLGRSDKPKALPMQKWIAGDVLPSIRKTGSYTARPKTADTPAKQNIEANRIFKSNHAVAKLLFKGNQALLSANQATFKATGINVLENLDATHLLAEKKEVLLTPSDIAKQLSSSPVKINLLLESKGFQQGYRDAKDRKCWKLTEKGENYAELLDTGKKQGNGTPVKQIKWHERIVSFLQ
ncbi:BRO family protein [Methylomonas methanica]|uniref:Prophage antirepressor n=1 Tax=Methylomonas methanica (strain DSM 25384 / MC09) TaxID=857087 RepID=G0A3S4_METMM|nr:BRO family protein [Methylomonas methanica]AEG02696.1 prophage antirepressor [Methylomonas methanica MC09]